MVDHPSLKTRTVYFYATGLLLSWKRGIKLVLLLAHKIYIFYFTLFVYTKNSEMYATVCVFSKFQTFHQLGNIPRPFRCCLSSVYLHWRRSLKIM